MNNLKKIITINQIRWLHTNKEWPILIEIITKHKSIAPTNIYFKTEGISREHLSNILNRLKNIGFVDYQVNKDYNEKHLYYMNTKFYESYMNKVNELFEFLEQFNA